MNSRKVQAVALSSVFVLFVGCGGTYDSTAKGVVTLNGAALPCGWIAFHPKAGGPAAYARVSENGAYEACTGSEQGLRSGDYDVTITANEKPAQARGKDGGPAAPGKLLTPAWYGVKEKSGLTVSVKPGKNDIDLKLTSTPPAGAKAGGQ